MKKYLTLLLLVVGLASYGQTFDFSCSSSAARPTLDNFTFSTSLTHNAFTNLINTGSSFTLFDYDTYTGSGHQTWNQRTDGDTFSYLDGEYFVSIEFQSDGSGVAAAIYLASAQGCCQLTLTLVEGSTSPQATLFLLE